MSTSASPAASASSNVSVAVHIAKRKPPSSTYCRIFRATAFLRSGTLAEPKARAISRFRSTSSVSHGAPA